MAEFVLYKWIWYKLYEECNMAMQCVPRAQDDPALIHVQINTHGLMHFPHFTGVSLSTCESVIVNHVGH